MRPLPIQLNLPDLTLKRYHHRPLQLPSHNFVPTLNPSRLLIFHISHLPLQFQLSYDPQLVVHLIATPHNLALKANHQVINLPWGQFPRSWLSVDLGLAPSQIKLNPRQNQNHLGQIHIYTSYEQWSKHEHEKGQPIQIKVEKIVRRMREGRVMNQEGEVAKGRASGERRRLKMRTKAALFESKTVAVRGEGVKRNELSSSQSQYARESPQKGSKQFRFQSSVFSQKIALELPFKRQNQTSSSVRSSMPFKATSQRLKQTLQSSIQKRATCSYDAPTGIDLLSKQPRRLKFYQQVPFTLEEIQIKRKKFQSQFISRPKEHSGARVREAETAPLTGEESQVMEDICRGEPSHVFEQTLERGLEDPAGFIEAEESGTLCESVFE